MRDLNNIPAVNQVGEENFKVAKNAIKEGSEKIKNTYINIEVEKKVTQGMTKESAQLIVKSRLENKVINPYDSFFNNDFTEIPISEIIENIEKYNKTYIRDLLEPEKGVGKAIINAESLENISIYSYLHGGCLFKISITYEYILNFVNKLYPESPLKNEENIKRIKDLCIAAKLSNSETRSIAKILKNNKVISSISDLDETLIQMHEVAFPNVKDKIILPTKENLEALLNHYNLKVKYDEILKDVQIESDEYIKETDNKINTFFAEIENLCVKNYLPTGVIKSYLWAIIDQNSFNPMLEMIDSKKWDGVDRLTQLIDSINTPDNKKYKDEVITRWLIQCVGAWDRAKKSPYPSILPRFENVLTFVGAQGINKTKFFELLLPRNLKQYVGTGIHLDPSNKDSIHLAIGKAITELGELDSTFNKDIARLKAFLSLSVDKYRRPYAKNESEFARRTSFCASVNDSEFLVDPSGNRRYWPLKIINIDFKIYEAIDKQQLWSQINETLYLKGEHWWIDLEHNPEVFKMLAEKHKEHAVLNPADEVALAVIEYTKSANSKDLVWKSATEIAIENKLSSNGRKNISIIKKRLMDEGIEFNSVTKKFRVCSNVYSYNKNFRDEISFEKNNTTEIRFC